MTDEQIEAVARSQMALTITPARRYINEAGQTVYSKVRAGTVEDLRPEEAECFLCHGFTIVENAQAIATMEPGA